MAYFIVSYDLHNQRTYQPVWTKLESWGGVRLLESLWLVAREATAMQIRDDLKSVVDSDDSVAIVELTSGSFWAGLRAKSQGVDWLKKNIRQ